MTDSNTVREDGQPGAPKQAPKVLAKARDDITWVGVLDACASLARESDTTSASLDEADRWFSAENTGKVLAGRARDAVDAPEPLHSCLAVFEAVAHERLAGLDGTQAGERNPKAMAGFLKALGRCGVVRGRRAGGEPCLAGERARQRGRALGRALVLMRVDMAMALDAVHVAEAFLADEDRCGRGRQSTLLDAFAGAVEVPGARIEATLGVLRNFNEWTQECQDYPYTPAPMAWLLGGMRLYMDARTRRLATECEAWDLGWWDACVEDMAKVVAGWDSTQVRQFRDASRAANAAVRAFNASKRDGIMQGKAGQRLSQQRAWAPTEVMRQASREAKRSVEEALHMAQVARRLGSVQDGHHGDKPAAARRRA